MTVQRLGALTSNFSSLASESSPETTDLLALRDVSAGTTDKITLADMLKVLNSLTEDASPDTANDFLLSYDTSASDVKKVKPSNIASTVSAYTGVGYAANRYYFGAAYRPDGSTVALTANRIYYLPFMIGSSETFTRIGVNVNTLAGGTSVRMGIYNAANGVPTSLVLDAGTVSSATTGDKEITISQALTAGTYFLVAVSDGTPTMLAIEPHYHLATNIFGAGSSAGSAGHAHKVYAFAALEANFTGSFASIAGNGAAPLIWLRKV